jgi:hypothetical protein
MDASNGQKLLGRGDFNRSRREIWAKKGAVLPVDQSKIWISAGDLGLASERSIENTWISPSKKFL